MSDQPDRSGLGHSVDAPGSGHDGSRPRRRRAGRRVSPSARSPHRCARRRRWRVRRVIGPRPSSPSRATSWSKQDVKAVIVRVTIDGQEIVTEALGESMTGVPATTDMHFRNGAVAISYVSTLLLRLVDQQVVTLDDPLATWLPDLPDADQVTLRMLANMTAGYPDFVQNPKLSQAFYADPVPAVDPRGADRASASRRRGSSRRGPTGTTRTPTTSSWDRRWRRSPASRWTSPCRSRCSVRWACATPSPGRRRRSPSRCCTPSARSGARRSASPPARASTRSRPTGTRPGRFAQGAIQTTDIVDMTTTAVAVGEGTLLSPASHQAQIAPDLLGFGAPLEGCPTCHTLDETYNYGLGVVLSGDWILQNPLFAGYGAVTGLPARREDRHRGGHDLWRGGLRRPGQLQVLQPLRTSSPPSAPTSPRTTRCPRPITSRRDGAPTTGGPV